MYCVCWFDLDPIQGQGHGAFDLPTTSEAVHAGGDDRSPLAGLSGVCVSLTYCICDVRRSHLYKQLGNACLNEAHYNLNCGESAVELQPINQLVTILIVWKLLRGCVWGLESVTFPVCYWMLSVSVDLWMWLINQLSLSLLTEWLRST